MDNKVIANRINEALAQNNVKQKELAAELGVKDNIISYFVSGKRTPNIEQIIKIADFFHITTDYLLGRTNVKSQDMDIVTICEKTGLSDDIVNCLTAFDSWLDNKASNKFPPANKDFCDVIKDLDISYSDLINCITPDIEIIYWFAIYACVDSINFIQDENGKHNQDLSIKIVGDKIALPATTAFDLIEEALKSRIIFNLNEHSPLIFPSEESTFSLQDFLLNVD